MTELSTRIHTEDELLGTAAELMAIPSTATNPDGLWAAHNLMTKFLHSAGVPGLVVEEFESNGIPSLLAYIGPERPKKFLMILNGHTDVVAGPEPFELKIKDGCFTGRGAVDMKIGAVVLSSLFLEFAPLFAQLNADGRQPTALGIQLVNDEEKTGYHGTAYQIEQGVQADLVICGECGRHPGVYDLANSTKGVARAVLTFESSDLFEPASGMAGRFLLTLRERYPVSADRADNTTVVCPQISSTGPDDERRYRPGPSHAAVTLDARYVRGDSDFNNRATFWKLLTAISKEAHVAQGIRTVDVFTFELPMYTDPSHPLLQLLKSAAETVEGVPFSLAQRAGTGDGRFYSKIDGAACEFGIVGEGEHTSEERVTREAVITYIATMRLFLSRVLEERRAAQAVSAQ